MGWNDRFENVVATCQECGEEDAVCLVTLEGEICVRCYSEMPEGVSEIP